MNQVLIPNNVAGSMKTNEPRPIGDIISEMFRSDKPLALGYRQFKASKENAEKGGVAL